jgi:hypothetical protein
VFAIGPATRNHDWKFVSTGKTITATRNKVLNFIGVKNQENFDLANLKVVKSECLESKNENVKTKEEEKLVKLTLSSQEKKAIGKNKILPNNDLTIIWHKRFGHTNYAKVKEMGDKQMVRGLEDIKLSNLGPTCDCCLKMKATKLRFNKEQRKRAEGKLDLVHTDICGPLRKPSKGGASYILTFIDDYSRKSDVYLLKRKNEVFEKFKNYQARVERETGRKIKILRSDNGSEFNNTAMDRYLKEQGIQKQLTTVYNPQQNGCAERLNRTLIEKTRCLLKDAHLPEEFWGEAVQTANHIRNYTKTTICGDIVPIELWTGRRPSVKYMRVFGCLAYATIPGPNRKGKLGDRAIRGTFVGYDDNRKSYRIWDEDKEDIIHSRDVRFIETEKGYKYIQDKTDRYEQTNSDYNIIDFSDMSTESFIQDSLRPQSIQTNLTETVKDRKEMTDEVQDAESDEASEREDCDDDSEEETSQDEENHDIVVDKEPIETWSDKSRLRVRTSKVKPTKYTFTTGASRPCRDTMEGLAREFGWNKYEDD